MHNAKTVGLMAGLILALGGVRHHPPLSSRWAPSGN